MNVVTHIAIALVILLHIYFLWLEMFAWTTVGRRTFRMMSPDMFEKTKAMAANQGLYNGFLAAGLLWSRMIQDTSWADNVALFFLSCVIVAALYGWYSISIRIFFVQGIPAIIAVLCVLIK
jgi:putative membrane protein